MRIADGTPMPSGGRRAAGWLDTGGELPVGPVGEPWRHRLFVERLFEACRTWRREEVRGYHTCPFCPPDDEHMLGVERHGRTAGLGNAEVHTTDPAGTAWAAPDLVFHYVDAHGYRPPDGFVASILDGTVAPPDQEPGHAEPGFDVQPGEELAPYAPDERLDDEHQAVAVRALADRAGVWPEGVEARWGFFAGLHLVCERAGARGPEGAGLPRLVVGIGRGGRRWALTARGYWDGTAEDLAGIVRASATDHLVSELRDEGWR
jgi:hypothetical protein